MRQGVTIATLDSPDEGRDGFKLEPFSLDKNRLAFELKATAAKYEGKLNAEGTEAVGTWSQRGLSLPLTFKQTKTPTASAEDRRARAGLGRKAEVGAGLSLRIVVHVGKTAEGKLMATMDSPDQGAKGLKVDTVTLDKTTLAFEMKKILGKYEGKLNAEGTEAAGTWTQAGNAFPLKLKKTDKATELRRPQTPKGPFPYKVVEVSYPNKPGGVTLAGTLTEPEGPGPFPAVILISGSGAQDRDETIFEHKPFLVLADALTRRGIAVLRVDDRGVGGSTGKTATSTSDDFAGDVLAGIAFLKTRAEIDGKRIGLMGHSEGGIIAPMVAGRSADVAFIVLLAGTGLPGEEILYLQGQAILKAMGAEEKDLKQQLEVQKKLFEILKTEKDQKTLETKLRDAAKAATDALPEDQRKAMGNVDALIASPAQDGPDSLVPLLPDLRPAAGSGEGPLPGPGAHRREGSPGPAQGEPLPDRVDAQGGRQQPGQGSGAAGPEPPVPDLQDRRTVRVRPDRGDHRPCRAGRDHGLDQRSGREIGSSQPACLVASGKIGKPGSAATTVALGRSGALPPEPPDWRRNPAKM